MPTRDVHVRQDSRLFLELCESLLRRGHHVQFRVHGDSMRPNLLDGDHVLVAPATLEQLLLGDVALTQTADGIRLHRVNAISGTGVTTRGDAGLENDPKALRLLGKVVSRRRGSREQSFHPGQTRFIHPIRSVSRRLRAAAALRLRRFALLLTGIFSLSLLSATLLAPNVHAQTADLQLTQTASASAVATNATNQSLGTASSATWAGGVATFTFPTPLPSGVFTGIPLTTTGFTPAAYNLTNASITSVNYATGAVTVALASQSMGTATAASWAGGFASFTFPTPLPSFAVVGAALTTTNFQPAGYNVTNAPITSVNNATGVIQVALATNPGAATRLRTGTVGPIASTTNGTGTVPTGYTYSEVVTNNSSSAQVGTGTITVYMQTPANTVFEAYTGANWSCTTPTAGNVGPIICTYNSTLNSGATASTLTLGFQIASGTAAGTTIQSSATVTNSTDTDPVPSNNTSITSIIVEPANTSDLALSMSVSPTPVFVSSTFTYTLQVQNLGQLSAPISSNVLSDTLPSGLTNVTVTPSSGWSCSGTTTVSCSITSPMAAGTTSTITISATSPSTAQTLSNSATVSLSGDPNSANNSATAYTVVQPIACATPGRDGAGGTITGVVNTYYPPATVGTLQSAATSVALGTAQGNTAKPITAGDLVLIIQMQDSSINATNTSSYGHGVPGDPGSGYINLGSSGLFEFVTATGFSGGTLTFTGTGPTGGLLNNYYYQPFTTSALGTASAASWSGNVASFTFPHPLPATVVPNSVLTTTNFTPAGYNVTNATILTANTNTGVITVALATNPGAATTLGTGSSSTQGHQIYQVIRVPQYASATLSSGLVPLAWPGGTAGSYVGGVLAIDVSSQLTLGGTVALDALGFRGGGGITLTGVTSGAGADTDYVTNSPANLPNLSGGGDAPANSGVNASKGEGIAGTPHWVAPLFSSPTFSTSSTAINTAQSTVEGLPAGSFARGAPGNAGGGGTDGDPVGNTENSGGGAGSNGGAGGQGGYGWNSMAATNSTDGGFGGVPFPASTSALVMGGGGGAGTVNNGSYYISSTSNGADCGTTCTGVYSSGGAGGGIAIIHAGSVVGTGTITSNGESTLSTLNDSTGGGGAGGSILVFANSGGLSGLTVSAVGGSAGNAWQTEAPGGFPGQRHGPGGGGGGGVIFLTAAPANSNLAASVAGGANGYTDTVQDSYGATPGLNGLIATTHVITETPGTQSGAYCGSADLAVTNSGTPSVVAPGGTIVYTQTVTNNGPLDAVNAVFSESIPANTTFQSLPNVSGWSCTTPAVNGTGTITCNNPDFPILANGGSSTFTLTVQVNGTTGSGTQIVDVDNITSGTTDPNLANNSATVVTTVAVATQADLAVTNTPSVSTVTGGSQFTMSAVVTNNGPGAASGLVFTESTASDSTGTINATFSSITAPGWSCTTPAIGASGNITCTLASLNANTSAGTIAIVETAPSATAGTVLSATANIASSTPDPNYSNNSSVASIEIANAGQSDLGVTSSPTPNPVTQGNNITYTQTVTNYGPAPATVATFTDTIPPGTTLGALFKAPNTNWTCNSIPVGGTGTISCSLNTGQSIAVGPTGSVNFPLVLNVDLTTSSGTTITNTANINVPCSSSSDPNCSNNSASTNVIVASPTQSSVSITKSASPEPVNQGTTLTYTITVTNGGPAAASGNFTVTDVLPPEVTYIPSAYSTSSGSCSGTTTVTCNIGSLPVGSTVVITINVTATTFSASSLSTNTATLTTTTTVPNAPTSLGAATAASWASNIASFTFPTPLPASLSTTSTLTTANFAPAGYNVSNASILSVNAATGVVTVALATNPGAATTLGTGSASIPYPLIAQSVSTIQSPTAVDIASINAYSQPDGTVRLVWHTLEESRNLGFHVYREDSTGQHRLDTSLIAGSALMVRGSRPQHAAKWYAWVDAHPVPGASYWIQDVDVNGTRTMHGPAYPEPAASADNQSRGMVSSARTLAPSPTIGQLRSNMLPPGSHASRPVTPVRVGPFPPPAWVTLFNVADHAAVQISVDQEGWYHIPFAQLFAAGLNPSTDVRLLHLYAEGVEQPLLSTGRSAGFPAPTDAIEFYGTGIDTPFSGTRVYWLLVENSLGQRILEAPAISPAGTVGTSFPFTTVLEDRTTYFAALLNGENNDNFFGDVVTSDAVDELLTVTHRDTSSTQPLTLTLTLQGVTDQQMHSVAVLLNGTNVGTLDFYGMTLASQSFTIDPSLVLDGTNDVNLTALNGDNDVSLVQSVQLNYLHTYTADSDWLRATAPAGSEVQVTGFSNSGVRLFDITNPLNILELNSTVSSQSGVYTVSAPVPAGAPQLRTILAVAQDTLSAPSSLSAYTPAFPEDQHAGADVVIISHPDFVSNLAPLVHLRESQGHHVALVTTDQIFDQYNFGERSPFAIRAFLQDAATHWARKPQFVLLVGDASFDPRDYLGFGDFDFVPTRIIETAAFKTASDDWFTDFQQTGYATIPTGRLPVRTTADVDLLVSKIVGYEQGTFSGSWNNQAVVISDQNVDSNFTSVATAAAATLPASLTRTQISADGVDPATVHSQILAALNSGALLVDYNGHGAEQQWSFSDIFDDTDASALTNGGRLPVYLIMACLNGFFQDVYAESLAKSLILSPNGGAVAVWASSGFTSEPPQASMNLAFLNQLVSHPNLSLGLMVLRAKAGTTDNDVRRTWILFGDPVMKLQLGASATSATSTSTSQRPLGPPATGAGSACKANLTCPQENPKQ